MLRRLRNWLGTLARRLDRSDRAAGSSAPNCSTASRTLRCSTSACSPIDAARAAALSILPPHAETAMNKGKVL